MATIEDSNKLTIYKGSDTDYAFIPLDVSESTYYDFTNGIIKNDASVYMKNIKQDSDLYNLINSSIINVSPIRDDTDPTISINNGTYNTSFIDSTNPAVPVNNLYLYSTTIISPIENNTDPAIPQPTLRFTMQPIDIDIPAKIERIN